MIKINQINLEKSYIVSVLLNKKSIIMLKKLSVKFSILLINSFLAVMCGIVLCGLGFAFYQLIFVN